MRRASVTTSETVRGTEREPRERQHRRERGQQIGDEHPSCLHGRFLPGARRDAELERTVERHSGVRVTVQDRRDGLDLVGREACAGQPVPFISKLGFGIVVESLLSIVESRLLSIVLGFDVEVGSGHHRNRGGDRSGCACQEHRVRVGALAATPNTRPKIETVPSSIPKTIWPAESWKDLRSRVDHDSADDSECGLTSVAVTVRSSRRGPATTRSAGARGAFPATSAARADDHR